MMHHVCVVRSDLPPGVRAAYLIHAAGESVRYRVPPGTRAVALAARDEQHLRDVAEQLERHEVDHRAVWEDGVLFAVGVSPVSDLAQVKRVTSSLPLMR